MQASPTDTADHTANGELGGLVDSWLRHLRAQRMSPATLSTYGTSARQLAAFLADRGMPTSPPGITREHVEAFVSDLLTRWKPATAHNRYRALRTFFGWLVEEGEIRDSPMARMKPPRLPEDPPAVLREPEMRRILDACERDKTFSGRRDEAVLRVLMDRPPRSRPWSSRDRASASAAGRRRRHTPGRPAGSVRSGPGRVAGGGPGRPATRSRPRARRHR